eukprot:GGOE01048092.1.p3 GENE.GGOE01048092.1~~GGOE01048092.1.p3  ORF type:complete len:100 (-),score=3.77 GGOE01048092.1:271-570(-)
MGPVHAALCCRFASHCSFATALHRPSLHALFVLGRFGWFHCSFIHSPLHINIIHITATRMVSVPQTSLVGVLQSDGACLMPCRGGGGPPAPCTGFVCLL